MAITVMAAILGITTERTENGIKAVRVAIERAGIGAIYGTLIASVATLNVPAGSGCDVELLSNVSDGATWGTMLGLMFSVVKLRRSITADSRLAKHPAGGFMFANLANASLFFGAAIGIATLMKLLDGSITP